MTAIGEPVAVSTSRLHSSIGMLPPIEYEQNHYHHQEPVALTRTADWTHKSASSRSRAVQRGMKLLLTSAGIKNTSIANALVEMLGKPIAEASALVIPTAAYPAGGPAAAWRIVSGRAMTPLCEIGWKSLGLLELSALPSIDAAQWIPMVRETDALLVGGGDPLYLAHWLQQSGAADVLPSLQDTVWVGVSAGSLVAAPHLSQDLSDWQSPTGSVEALGLVDFGIFPHLDNPNMPEFGLADAERWAAALDVPGYAIDDQTAITVIDGEVAVVSEGHWKLFD